MRRPIHEEVLSLLMCEDAWWEWSDAPENAGQSMQDWQLSADCPRWARDFLMQFDNPSDLSMLMTMEGYYLHTAPAGWDVEGSLVQRELPSGRVVHLRMKTREEEAAERAIFDRIGI